MWFHPSSLFLWEDIGFSCGSKNVVLKQRFEPNPAHSLAHHAWGKVDVFHLDICDPGLGAGALPALRNFVFWHFFGHEMGMSVWSWGHSIGTALKSSDFLPQGKCSKRGQLLSSPGSPFQQQCTEDTRNPAKQTTIRSGTVPESEPEGWIWGSPPWAAIKLFSSLTRDVLPTDHQPGAVLQ